MTHSTSLPRPLTALLMAATLCTGSQYAEAAHDHHKHSTYAPIGIMGEHLMGEDEWMLSYRFMGMDMEGNRSGTNRVATPLPGFMVSPLTMDMDMHMLGGMVGITDSLTMMVMLPYLTIDMAHEVNMNGVRFTTQARGIGDVSITAMVSPQASDVILNIGLSLPTGAIDQRDVTPASAGVPVQLPYPMQTGSGTYDLLLGASQQGRFDTLNWGAQAQATIRTGSNDNGYRLGDVAEVSAWLATAVADSVQTSFRLKAQRRGNIDGTDTTLAATPTVPTKEANLRAGSRIDALVGLNFMIGDHLLGIELAIPVYQKLDGPQLETDRVLTVGWQAVY